MKKKITMIVIVLSYLFAGLNLIVYEYTYETHYSFYIGGCIFLLMIPISLIDDRNNTAPYCICLILLVFIPTSLMLLLNDIGFWIMIFGEISIYIISIYTFTCIYRKSAKVHKTDDKSINKRA